MLASPELALLLHMGYLIAIQPILSNKKTAHMCKTDNTTKYNQGYPHIFFKT